MSISPEATTDPTWTELADRVWTARLEPGGVTTAVVAGSDGALVVDPGPSAAHGAVVRAAAERLTGVPVLGAVASHAHFDHAFGLAAFDDLSTWGHESLAASLADPVVLAEAAAHGVAVDPPPVPPNRPFSLVAGLQLGGRWVELVHLGDGHTRGDVVVVVGDAGLVLVGDLLESAGPPCFGPDSAPEAWPTTLDAVIGLLGNGRSRAVPGHGEVMELPEVMLQRGQLAAVAGEIERLLRAGVDVDQAVASGSWPWPGEHLGEAVRSGYRRLAALGIGPDVGGAGRDLGISPA